MPTPYRRSIVFAAAAGFSAVALGSFGAHALRPTLEAQGRFHTWDTAVLYHLLHSVALLALALHLQRETRPMTARRLGRASWLMTAGLSLFSGSLYLFAIGGPRWLMYVTPVGGLSLLAGWLAVGHAFWQDRDQ